MRIYQADVWCDDCGRAIEDRLKAEGKAPEDTLDEGSYDSGDYPKWGDDDEECDTPQHCAAGAECLNPTVISGEKYGAFLANPLTRWGLEYVSERATEDKPGPVALFWAHWYEGDGLCGKPCYRLADHACVKCGRKVNPYDCDGHGAHEDCES